MTSLLFIRNRAGSCLTIFGNFSRCAPVSRVGTASGGLRRLKDGRFTSITTQEGLSDNSVRCLFEDRESNLWVRTIGGGLNRIKPKRVTTYTTRDGLSHNVIMSLAEDKEGTLWIGSNCGGLNTRRNGTIQPFTTTGLLDNECIWSLLSAGDGSVWVGTWGGGLYRVRGYDVSQFPFPRPAQDQPVVAMCEDLEGNLCRDLRWRRQIFQRRNCDYPLHELRPRCQLHHSHRTRFIR